jgi:hypothetical protein
MHAPGTVARDCRPGAGRRRVAGVLGPFRHLAPVLQHADFVRLVGTSPSGGPFPLVANVSPADSQHDQPPHLLWRGGPQPAVDPGEPGSDLLPSGTVTSTSIGTAAACRSWSVISAGPRPRVRPRPAHPRCARRGSREQWSRTPPARLPMRELAWSAGTHAAFCIGACRERQSAASLGARRAASYWAGNCCAHFRVDGCLPGWG